MPGVPKLGTVEPLGVYWYLREKKGKLYLVRVEFHDGERHEDWIGNVEAIHKIIKEYKKRNTRPYTRSRIEGRNPQVAPRAGFEPATTGLQGPRYKYPSFTRQHETETLWQGILSNSIGIGEELN